MKTSADWRNSRDHITFLRHFLKPAPAPAHDLREDFGETNEAVIRGLVEGGALQVCELQDLVAHAFRKQELQSLLRRHGRGIDGNKTQLAARALQAAHAEVEPRASKIMLFKCTPLGREVYEDLVKRTERAEEQGKQRTFRLLLQGKLRDAFEEPARFFREFVNPDVAGATLSKWGMHQAKLLLELRGFWALDKYREDERKLILAALAMAEAWSVKPSDWVPEELITRLQSDPRLFYLTFWR